MEAQATAALPAIREIGEVREASAELVMREDPNRILANASKAATALVEAIRQSSVKPIKMGESEHLRVEHWQTCGRFFDLGPRVDKTEYITFGNYEGFRAFVSIVHLPTGRVVSSGEAMCMTDEEKWGARPKYEWHYVLKGGGTSKEDPGTDQMVWEPNPSKPGKNKPKKERVLAGTERPPLFQLSSMAQTRAISKAFRGCLSWIVVMADAKFSPTPAEEIEDMQMHDAEIVEPKPVPAKKTTKPKDEQVDPEDYAGIAEDWDALTIVPSLAHSKKVKQGDGSEVLKYGICTLRHSWITTFDEVLIGRVIHSFGVGVRVFQFKTAKDGDGKVVFTDFTPWEDPPSGEAEHGDLKF